MKKWEVRQLKLNLYIRLSQSDIDLKNKSESESIANQRTLLYQFLKTHPEFQNYEVVEFCDDGYSGTNDARPSFERMIEGLKAGDAQVVICKDFSRFFRDYVEIGDYLERIFPFLGVRFIAVNDNYDSNDYKGTTGGIDVVMKYIVYSYYSRDLSQKIKTVLKSKARHGQFIGAYAPYGYQKDPANKNHLVVDVETSPVVRLIFDLALEGKIVSEIATVLNQRGFDTPSTYHHKCFPESKRFRHKSLENCWDANNVRRILQEKQYTGAVISEKRSWKGIDNPQTLQLEEKDWIVVPDCHEAIVTLEEYDRAQQVMRKIKKYKRGPSDYPLRGLMRCGECGRALQRNSRAKIKYYKCELARFKEETVCPIGEKFNEKELEQAVIGNLTQMLTLLVDCDRKMQTAANKTKGSANNLRQSILQIEKTLKQKDLAKVGAYEKYVEGELSKEEYVLMKDTMLAAISELQEEKKKLEQQLDTLQSKTDPEFQNTVAAAKNYLKAEEVNNQLLLFFVDRVYVYSGMRIEVQYKFSDSIKKTLEEMQNITP